MSVVHLVVGPEQHGVVLHGTQISRACGQDLIRLASCEDWPALRGVDVVHVPFTDRLFGHELEEAARSFGGLRDHVHAGGAALSVTLHDVPHGDGTLPERRRALYRSVIESARGVVVNSRVELALLSPLADSVHSLRMAPLPVLAADAEAPSRPEHAVGVLGFVFPDRGYEDVIAALPPDARLVALGRASDGHKDLPERYARLARDRWSMTGYLTDDELAVRLRAIAVAVAPNRRVTASASINTWIAHGRRPLVPDCAYTREVDADRPGTITRYDPDDPDGLRRTIAAAFEDPASTWIDEGVGRGPSLEDVATIYREHLDACSPAAALRVPGGRTVPGNRWDLLVGHRAPPPTVSVVVPYYEAQAQLDRTLAALTAQTHPADRLEIVIADDGSSMSPDTTAADDVPTTIVRQDDRGFRAGAARNLGAAAATGDVLVFLDADTAPEPDFVARLTALPARCPDAVTVGHRRHADLASDPPTVLDEPGWLQDAYRGSRDLLDADGRSYRYIISAVLAMRRSLFRELGGFDERFVGYGGEDWELAHRAWVAGAVFAHVPDAVAWHDGPDWAGRPEAHRPDAKQAETLALDLLLPDPEARGGGQWLPYPAVVVRIGSCRGAELVTAARAAFSSGADVGFWCEEVTGPYAELVLADPRLRQGPPPPDVLARARWTVELTAPGRIDFAALPAWCRSAERHGCVAAPGVVVRSTRAINRARRWWPNQPERYAARLFGRHDR